ncbi:MAG TPA: lipocalin family protein [Flavobacterium sp.]|nr:lipocalin family protein [Flavobacterium sp.]
MKKFYLLFVSVLTLGLTSCNNDDDAGSDTGGTLEGRWEYFQEGTLVNGQEVLHNYEHAEGCTKDFGEFLAGGVAKDYTYSNNGTATCDEEITTGTWSRSGNMITLTFAGFSVTAEIMTLNATTLKVKYTETVGTTTMTFIDVYRRI